MLPGHRPLLLVPFTLALLAACGTDYTNSETGITTPSSAAAPVAPPAASLPFSGAATIQGSHDSVVATPSAAAIAVVVGAAETVSITFASSDGRPMSGLSLSEAGGASPAGWNLPAGFTCAAVTTGSSCVLNLTYAPTAVDSGTLTLNYVIVDDSGLASTTGSASIAYAATAGNNVIATASPSGEIDAAMDGGVVAVGVNFTTDDGNPATGVVVTTDLAALPNGWSAAGTGATPMTCPVVSTGNGCELRLTFDPVDSGGGTLTLAYGFTDDTGAAKTGTVTIPYRATSSNQVIATAAPSGQVTAVEKTGRRAVPITFTTDDGKAATQLKVTSDLGDLPAGWSSGTKSFGCASVANGNGCQLPLDYAPSATAAGTLTVAFSYTDGTGAARNGLLNVAYAATTDDHVVGTPSPAGQVNAVAGLGAQMVNVTFTTDDGRPATGLQVNGGLGALPPGWSSAAATFACTALDADSVCMLPLAYAPTTAGSGTLSLPYSYVNNAGVAGTGTVDISYRATSNDSVVGTPGQSSLAVSSGSSTGDTVTFTTDDGNPASSLTLTTDLATLPPGWTSGLAAFSCTSVSAGTACTLPLTYAPVTADAGALTLAFSYANDAGIAKTGTVTISYAATGP